MDLTDAATIVTGEGTLDRSAGGQAARQRVEHGRREIAVRHGLRGDRPDAGAHERAGRAHGERLGGDGNRECTGCGIMDDNGPGHAAD
jgi:hypothetical protein